MKTCFIVNPVAGRGRTVRWWRELEPVLRRELPAAAVHFTDAPGAAVALSRRACEEGYGRIIAVGGDGTVHEVVNGMAGSGSLLGIIPTGTGNDFARTLSIPRRPSEAARTVVAGHTATVDLGCITAAGGSGETRERYFAGVAGIGFDAEVAAEVNRNRRRSWAGYGTLPYVLCLLRVLFSYRNAPVSLSLDGRTREAAVLLVAVGNGRAYGGGMRITPLADATDGLFDVCAAGDVGKLEVLLLIPRVYTGRHIHHPKVSYQRAGRVEIECRRPLAVHADGEVVGTTPAAFTLIPRGLRVIVPEIHG